MNDFLVIKNLRTGRMSVHPDYGLALKRGYKVIARRRSFVSAVAAGLFRQYTEVGR